MKEIIPRVDRELILAELTEDNFLKHTNKGGNQLYLVSHKTAPNILDEIGRLRELSFRQAGGGTGKESDLDSYDVSEFPFRQLIAWDPEDQEIIAGYRLLMCKNAERDERGQIVTATSHLFELSDKFNEEYLPYTAELGRSFVQPRYQSRSESPKGLYSLDNLWDGLGAFAMINPDLKYFFGKVTMYPDYHREARNILLSFMHQFFPDKDDLVLPANALITKNELEEHNHYWEGLTYKEGFQRLNKLVRKRGENIPPLINSYMNLSPSMKTFGTALNSNFGEVEETAILVTINDIFEGKKDSYFGPRKEELSKYIGPLVSITETRGA